MSEPNPDLRAMLCGIRLDDPILNASGTFDAIAAKRVFGRRLIDRFPFSAFVSKTITVAPRHGNPPPRLWEASGGLVNSIGLPNKGLDGFLAEDLPQLAALPVPLIVSVMGSSPEEFAELVEGVAPREEVAAIELNVSCPNVHSGLIVGEQPVEAEALLVGLRELTAKPLIVKLTPNLADPAAVGAAAVAGGADALSLINTVKATPIDPETLRPWLGNQSGGLSGPAVMPIALAQVRAVAAAVPSTPIIGMGGIESGLDALMFLAAGADLVAVGTACFRDPLAAERIRQELTKAMRERSIFSISEIPGRTGWALASTEIEGQLEG